MFWTSIKLKIRHLSRILLTYIAYESNVSVILSKTELLFILTILLSLSTFL